MTQKSAARKERDAHKNEMPANNAWGDLLVLRNTMLNALGVANSHLRDFCRDESMVPYLENVTAFNEAVIAHAQDLTVFIGDIDKVFELHKDKDGAAKSEAEIFEALRIGEQYSMVQSRYDGVGVPSAQHIAKMIDDAHKRRFEAEKPAAPAQDEVAATEEVPTEQAQAEEQPAT
jgi:hypothetical protein